MRLGLLRAAVPAPVSIARLVMEKTPHVMLAGDGADRFAQLHGMTPADLLTGDSRAAWQKWLAEHAGARRADQAAYVPPANIEEKRPHGRAGRLRRRRCARYRRRAGHAMPPGSLPGPARPAARPSRCPAAWAIRPSSATACTSIRASARRWRPAWASWSWACAGRSWPSRRCAAAPRRWRPPSRCSNESSRQLHAPRGAPGGDHYAGPRRPLEFGRPARRLSHRRPHADPRRAGRARAGDAGMRRATRAAALTPGPSPKGHWYLHIL